MRLLSFVLHQHTWGPDEDDEYDKYETFEGEILLGGLKFKITRQTLTAGMAEEAAIEEELSTCGCM